MSLNTVEEIERAIGSLAPQELNELLLWLERYSRWQSVDHRTQADLAEDGHKLQQNQHSPANARLKPQFGILHGKVKVPEDQYIINEPAEVRVELYGEEYR